MSPTPRTPSSPGSPAADYKLTLYGSCPGCGQFSGKIEWLANGFRALRERHQRESPNGYCTGCRRDFPLTWAQVRLRGRMIREGEVQRILVSDGEDPASGT
ncbi:MAG: hypothetical protein U0610_24100 [bacterium]